MARRIQKFMVGIKGFIMDNDALLLVKSSADREALWELPGGRYDVGEETLPPPEILTREIREELGPHLQVSIGRPVYAWVRPLGQAYVFLLAYDCRYRGGEIIMSHEHSEFRWVKKNGWRDLPLAPGYTEALDHFWKNR